jgi:hypothetical protein
MKKLARLHHFVPRGYLAGFTDRGTRDGRLFVYDCVTGKVFPTQPGKVGAERDFNRIELDGHDPDALEGALGEFEDRAISVIRGIQASRELPADEEFSYVINLMALLVVRNPRFRANMNKAMDHTVRVMGNLLVSDKRLYEHRLAKAKAAGFVSQDAEVSFETMRQFIHDDQYTVTVSTSESLLRELGLMDKALQHLGTRHWTLVTAALDAPDFVTCDHPVAPIFKDPNRRGPIGYGLSETEVSFPLNTRQALLGVFENPLPPIIEVDAKQVAGINSRTVHHAYRQVYSKIASIVVLTSRGISTLP